MIRVHATKASINGYKVRLLLALLRQPYELVELDMYGGEHKREPFLSLNPFGQMPALTDGAFTIADISCFGPISMLKVSGYDTDQWPNVTRWLNRIQLLPGAHDIDGKPF